MFYIIDFRKTVQLKTYLPEHESQTTNFETEIGVECSLTFQF